MKLKSFIHFFRLNKSEEKHIVAHQSITMSNYQNLERDFAQMHVRDQGGGADYQRIPPATAPKPKAYTSAPAPFKPGKKSVVTQTGLHTFHKLLTDGGEAFVIGVIFALYLTGFLSGNSHSLHFPYVATVMQCLYASLPLAFVGGGDCAGFFLICRDFWGFFCVWMIQSLPVPFFQVEISSRTPVPLF